MNWPPISTLKPLLAQSNSSTSRSDQRLSRASTTAELLGTTEGPGLRQLAADLPPTGDGRAQMFTFAVLLSALEARTGGARP
jgi:hypothetical protein